MNPRFWMRALMHLHPWTRKFDLAGNLEQNFVMRLNQLWDESCAYQLRLLDFAGGATPFPDQDEVWDDALMDVVQEWPN